MSSPMFSGNSSPGSNSGSFSLEGTQEFLNSNSLVAKFAFLLLILIVFVLASCQSNLNNNIIDNNDEKILWKSSDEYPSVKLCNDLEETDLIKQCFQTFLSNQIFDPFLGNLTTPF